MFELFTCQLKMVFNSRYRLAAIVRLNSQAFLVGELLETFASRRIECNKNPTYIKRIFDSENYTDDHQQK